MKTITFSPGLRGLLTFLTTLFLVSTTFFTLAQSVWNADATGGTSDWNTASNWIGGVPDANKTATIFECNTCPVISTAGNQSKFVQIYPGGKLTLLEHGKLTIENPGGPGMKTHAGSEMTIDTGGVLTLKNFWGEGMAIGGVFQNDGSISINGGHTGIAVSEGAIFTNNGETSVTGNSLNFGLKTLGTVSNKGSLSIDDANNDGIHQQAGSFTNETGGIVHLTKTGVNAIFAKGNFQNDGNLNIDNGLNGLYVLFATFNNNANGKLNISGSSFLNTGIYLDPGTFNNDGELTVKNALSKGIEISSNSSFNNFNKIVLDVPAWAGIFNVGGSVFHNHPCALIESSASIVNYAAFTNSGIIKAPNSGGTTINVNLGSLIGTFKAGSGNAPVTESSAIVWTGCADNAWNNPANWYPDTLPGPGFYRTIIQNVSQASGNAPVVSTSSSSTNLVLDKNAGLTIASGGSLNVSYGYLGYGQAEIRAGANLTIMPQGRLSASYIGVNGNVQNSGEVFIPAPFHSVGSFGMSGGVFNNLQGSQLTGSVGQYGAGVTAGLSNGAVFTNSGHVSLDGFGGFNLNNSSLFNTSTGLIAIGFGLPGRINLENSSLFENDGSLFMSGKINTSGSTCINNGEMNISYGYPGLYGEDASYTNNGTLNMTSCHILLYGGYFSNSGEIDIQSPQNDGVINGGIFSNTGKLAVSNSGNHHGVLNLFDGKFYNETSGELFFNKTSNGFINFGHLSNAGLLDINTTNYARGLENQGTVVNQTTGQILIKDPKTDGLVTFYNPFENHGYIEILNASGWGLAASGPLDNKSTGHINVNAVGKSGVASWNWFKNAGLIESENTGYEGVTVAYGEFDNLPGSEIFIRNTTGAGLINFDIFQNQGYLSIDNPGAEGIRNLNFKFDNRPGGSTVVISNAQNGPGIYTSNGFFNTGYIILENTPLAVQIEPSGYFNNHPCSEVRLDGRIDNKNVINNAGLLTSTFHGVNTGSGFLNNKGILEDVFGSFTGLPIVNSGLRARPIAGTMGGFIQNAVEVGFNSPFQISSTWYSDAGLTTPAGTYINGVNTFQPTVGTGTHLLYFTAKDLVNGCTKTVSVQVNIASLLAGGDADSKTFIKLFNFPNPFRYHTTIQLSLPFDSEGKIVVFDNFGRETSTIYQGALMKDELYQFDFDSSDTRVSSYTATLILKNGRTWSTVMVKAGQ